MALPGRRRVYDWAGVFKITCGTESASKHSRHCREKVGMGLTRSARAIINKLKRACEQPQVDEMRDRLPQPWRAGRIKGGAMLGEMARGEGAQQQQQPRVARDARLIAAAALCTLLPHPGPPQARLRPASGHRPPSTVHALRWNASSESARCSRKRNARPVPVPLLPCLCYRPEGAGRAEGENVLPASGERRGDGAGGYVQYRCSAASPPAAGCFGQKSDQALSQRARRGAASVAGRDRAEAARGTTTIAEGGASGPSIPSSPSTAGASCSSCPSCPSSLQKRSARTPCLLLR
ncbi:hypothetical protein EJ04DRAFT_599768 [Polyplosphaeria fusca]|uniref:Uncharacterized protein n=1 Tax=Polyplosphaeria fusca TaxID=682080 RepID=A0A9P4R044_9PLEO|nr:hypothetical protein EJ04DRAFT_599768 [Polyplosphaeria fusca]